MQKGQVPKNAKSLQVNVKEFMIIEIGQKNRMFLIDALARNGGGGGRDFF